MAIAESGGVTIPIRYTIYHTQDTADLVHVHADKVTVDENGFAWFFNNGDSEPVGVVNPRNWIAITKSPKV